MAPVENDISQEYAEYLQSESFPCVAAKAAQHRKQAKTLVAGHMACPADDKKILEFLYQFVDDYRLAKTSFHSAAIIFQGPENVPEQMFEELMWQRLQSLSNMDAQHFPFDPRVSKDPLSPKFSFSLKAEAFFILGLHPNNSRTSRRFRYPTIVFNPHDGFEQMKAQNQYEKMKRIVRKKDLIISGSINPMLDDFGKSSEVFQYSGKHYPSNWQCPLHIKHGTANNTTA